ncbi:hypothetical protein Dda3937_00621 [Dickeya dadantii 3937]|uniref:Uncharacterized protein n=1 Tax=Dickeya dadantii (strain 3937) TaxID=198628 RepID=E0SE72_DICD3|nr:hypothetical protein Dda3937_00621 [Dickeya dadantii 3937]
MQVCWLRSFTRINYLNKLIGILSLAVFLQLELFWAYKRLLLFLFCCKDSLR